MESSTRTTSGAWVTSEIASRNTAMTAGSIDSRYDLRPKKSQQLVQGLAITRCEQGIDAIDDSPQRANNKRNGARIS